MKQLSEAAKALAAKLDGVEIGHEAEMIGDEAEQNVLVVVYGASDNLIEFAGAMRGEGDVYCGGTVYIYYGELLDEGDFNCGCQWAAEAKEEAIMESRTIEALWCAEPEISWTYETDIPHATFNVMEDGETYCRGIVFDYAALE